MNDSQEHPVVRLQIAMWLPARCMWCRKEYKSVDDFIARNPRAWGDGEKWTYDPDNGFVDDACYDEALKHKEITRLNEIAAVLTGLQSELHEVTMELKEVNSKIADRPRYTYRDRGEYDD